MIDLDREILEGSFPKKQLTYVTAWVLIHSDELKANWQLINETGEYFKIESLK